MLVSEEEHAHLRCAFAGTWLCFLSFLLSRTDQQLNNNCQHYSGTASTYIGSKGQQFSRPYMLHTEPGTS